MYNRIKKILPTGMLTVGSILSAVLLIMAYFTGKGTFSYESFVMTEYLRQAAVVIFTECLIAAIIFKIYLKKEKPSDHDFEQKG